MQKCSVQEKGKKMYFDIFKEYTKEEQARIERYNRLRGQVADLKLSITEKEFELSHLKDNKNGDMIPLFLWSAVFVPSFILFIMDWIIAWEPRAGIAVAFVTGIPIFIVAGTIGILFSLNKLRLKYSKSVKVQKKAKEKGIINVVMREGELVNQINAARREISFCSEEMSEIEGFFREQEESAELR